MREVNVTGKRRTLIPRSQTRKQTPRSKPAQRPKERNRAPRGATTGDAMKYRLAGASYRAIAEKLTADQGNSEYADANGVSFERAMKKIPHVSKRTVWDDVAAEYEELRRETEENRADSDGARERQTGSAVLEGAVAVLEGRACRLAGWQIAVMGRRAKLNGLEAPTKIAPTDPTGEHPGRTPGRSTSTR